MSNSPTGTGEPTPTSGEGRLAVRKALMQDIPELLRLINDYAGKGVMLARTEFEIAENLRDFSLVEVDGKAAGCAALHFYSSVAGEVRSLAVDPAFQGLGAGRRLVEALEEESQSFGLASVFAFTYIPDFFAKLGFEQIDRSELPLKAWKDCMRCPKFQCCDEIAVVKRLQCSQKRVEKPPMRGSLPLAPVLPTDPVVLPILSKSH